MTDKLNQYFVTTEENDFLLYDCNDNVSMRLYKDAEEDNFDKFRNILLEKGFSEYDYRRMENCRFSSLLKNKELVQLVYSYPQKELRIIDDEYTVIPNIIKPEPCGLCPVRLWQFEVDHSLIDCGMCYIIQCSDYSFFIVDSAHPYSVNDDIRIYEFLRSKTPSHLPVRVAGWFFSHGHDDHIGKFMDVFRYNKDIIIEGLYYNFVSNGHFSSDSWMESTKSFARTFIKEVNERDIPIYKLHSGQRFYIRDLEIDVLCTHEDVFPASLENYNDSSTVLMVRIGEDKICFPGDAGGEESAILEKRYPNELKCDIMQVAHHGHFGTSPLFYQMANARVALFATTQIKYDEEYPRYEANRVADALSEHLFIASNGTVEFTFPLKGSKIKKYPDETFENFDGIYNLWSYDYTQQFKDDLNQLFEKNQKTECFDY